LKLSAREAEEEDEAREVESEDETDEAADSVKKVKNGYDDDVAEIGDEEWV